jgi:hypothetical protein
MKNALHNYRSEISKPLFLFNREGENVSNHWNAWLCPSAGSAQSDRGFGFEKLIGKNYAE